MTCRALQEIDVREQLDRRDPPQESAVRAGAGNRSDSKRALDGKTAKPVMGAFNGCFASPIQPRSPYLEPLRLGPRGTKRHRTRGERSRPRPTFLTGIAGRPGGRMGVTAFELAARLCRDEGTPALPEVRCSTTR
jgi:hypothetical protein